MSTMQENSYITITGKEYKKFILDTELWKERMQLEKKVEQYAKMVSSIREELEKQYKCTIDKKDNRIDELILKIKKYESNWFVKLFLKDNSGNRYKSFLS